MLPIVIAEPRSNFDRVDFATYMPCGVSLRFLIASLGESEGRGQRSRRPRDVHRKVSA